MTSRGQSMVEAMVALTIIITSITSAMALVQSSITASRIGGSQVVASNLAREGLEVVRAMRDSNWLAGTSFQAGLTDPANKAARLAFDPTTATWSLVFGALTFTDPLSKVYQSPDGSFTQISPLPGGATQTPYKRIVTINYICRNTTTGAERIEAGAAATCSVGTELLVGLAVNSAVNYASVGGGTRTLNVEERLYDWR